MSTFETLSADSFIYEEALTPRDQTSITPPFLRKNIAYVVDQQGGNGSYNAPEVIIDSQAIASSGNLIDWRNGYIAVPMQDKWEATFTTAPGAGTLTAAAKFALALKNMALLDQLKVEANGKVILNATQGLANLITFKQLTTMTPASLQKDGATIGFYPDDAGAIADTVYDNINNVNDFLSTTLFGDAVFQTNRGLIERQQNWLPHQQTSVLSSDNTKDAGYSYDSGVALSSITTAQALQDVHWVAIIRLRDIADLFDKHPLARGVAYRFTLRFNQAVSTLTQISGTTFNASTPSLVSTSQISGSCQPAMLCVGPNTMTGRMSWTNASVVTHTVTHKIDTSADARFSGVRLYVPSYELEPSHQEKLMRNPVIKRNFIDFMTQTTQTSISAGGFFNVQVSTSATNPRALVVIPRWAQSATTYNNYTDASPLTCTPGCTDALLALKNVQVKMGSSYVLPDRLQYDFSAFLDNVRDLFSNDGAQSNTTVSGLISKRMFETNHRYYAFDLSRYPEAMTNLPQMVSVEGNNNTQQPIELLCILLYGREAEWNLQAGSMTITA